MANVIKGETEILSRDEDGLCARLYLEDTFYGTVRIDVESIGADDWTSMDAMRFDENGEDIKLGRPEVVALEACSAVRAAVSAEVSRLWGVR